MSTIASAAALLSLTLSSGGLLIGSAPQADGWVRSLDPKALATYLDADEQSLLVATAGDSAKEARPAAKALLGALRATGKTRLVLDDGALGDLSGLSDSQIVQRCGSSPVEAVAVVRVFPGSDGRPAVAVVTFFSKQSGSTLAAFTVEQGSPLPPRAGGSAQALPSAALESVRQVERDGVEPSPPASPGVQGSVRTREERQRDYDERFIWSHETAVVDLGTGAVVNRWTNFFQGREGVSLDGESLYIALKRYDLAATYHSRSNAKTWLIVGGVLGAIGGYGVFTAGLFVPGPCTTMDSLTNTCVTNQFGNAPLLIAGGIVGTVGLGVMIAGLFVNPNPIDAAAAHRLVDEFNGKLKSDLGLGSSADRASDPPAVSWNVDAFSTRGGGGLTLRLNL